MTPEMQSAIQAVIDLMITDYSQDGTPESMIKKYKESFGYEVGIKYIKVKNHYGIKFFVVNCTNDKQYPYGTILKAANWKAPERNFARGNVFSIEKSRVDWYGVHVK